MVNKLRGIFSVLAIKAPDSVIEGKKCFKMSALSRGAVYFRRAWKKLDSVSLDDLGARRVVATKDNTTIVGGAGSKKKLKTALSNLKPRLRKLNLIMIRKNCRNGLVNYLAVLRLLKSARRPNPRRKN